MYYNMMYGYGPFRYGRGRMRRGMPLQNFIGASYRLAESLLEMENNPNLKVKYENEINTIKQGIAMQNPDAIMKEIEKIEEDIRSTILTGSLEDVHIYPTTLLERFEEWKDSANEYNRVYGELATQKLAKDEMLAGLTTSFYKTSKSKFPLYRRYFGDRPIRTKLVDYSTKNLKEIKQ